MQEAEVYDLGAIAIRGRRPLSARVRAVLRTDITEEDGSPLPLSDQTATLSATPYEIVTLLLEL